MAWATWTRERRPHEHARWFDLVTKTDTQETPRPVRRAAPRTAKLGSHGKFLTPSEPSPASELPITAESLRLMPSARFAVAREAITDKLILLLNADKVELIRRTGRVSDSVDVAGRRPVLDIYEIPFYPDYHLVHLTDAQQRTWRILVRSAALESAERLRHDDVVLLDDTNVPIFELNAMSDAIRLRDAADALAYAVFFFQHVISRKFGGFTFVADREQAEAIVADAMTRRGASDEIDRARGRIAEAFAKIGDETARYVRLVSPPSFGGIDVNNTMTQNDPFDAEGYYRFRLPVLFRGALFTCFVDVSAANGFMRLDDDHLIEEYVISQRWHDLRGFSPAATMAVPPRFVALLNRDADYGIVVLTAEELFKRMLSRRSASGSDHRELLFVTDEVDFTGRNLNGLSGQLMAFDEDVKFCAARVSGYLDLSGCVFRKRLDLSAVEIGGTLDLRFIDVLDRPEFYEDWRPGPVLSLANARIHGDCLFDGTRVWGLLSGAGLNAGGNLGVTTVCAEEIDFSHAKVEGSVFFGAGAGRIVLATDEESCEESCKKVVDYDAWPLWETFEPGDFVEPRWHQARDFNRPWLSTIAWGVILDFATLGAVVAYAGQVIHRVVTDKTPPISTELAPLIVGRLSMHGTICAGNVVLNGINAYGQVDLQGLTVARLLIAPSLLLVVESGPETEPQVQVKLLRPQIIGELLAVGAKIKLDLDLSGLQVSATKDSETGCFDPGCVDLDNAEIGTDLKTYSDARLDDLRNQLRWALSTLFRNSAVGTSEAEVETTVDDAFASLQEQIFAQFEPTRIVGDFTARNLRAGGGIILCSLKCGRAINIVRATLAGSLMVEPGGTYIARLARHWPYFGRTVAASFKMNMLTCRGNMRLRGLSVVDRTSHPRLDGARLADSGRSKARCAPEEDCRKQICALYAVAMADKTAAMPVEAFDLPGTTEPPHVYARNVDVGGAVLLRDPDRLVPSDGKEDQADIFGAFDFSRSHCAVLRLPDQGFSDACHHYAEAPPAYMAAASFAKVRRPVTDDLRHLGITLEGATIGTLFGPKVIPWAVRLTGVTVRRWREPDGEDALDYFMRLLANDVDGAETTYKAVQQEFLRRGNDEASKRIYVALRRHADRTHGRRQVLSYWLFDYYTRPWKKCTLGLIGAVFVLSWLGIFSNPDNFKAAPNTWSWCHGAFAYSLRTFMPPLDLSLPAGYTPSDGPLTVGLAGLPKSLSPAIRGILPASVSVHAEKLLQGSSTLHWRIDWLSPWFVVAALRLLMTVYWAILVTVIGAGILERRAVGT